MKGKNKTEELQEMIKEKDAAEDRKELKELVSASLPSYLPKDEINDNEKLLSETQKLGIGKMKEFVSLDIETIETKPKHISDILHKQAKIGFDLYRERNIQARANEGVAIKIYHLVAEDRKELKELVSASLPSYLPK